VNTDRPSFSFFIPFSSTVIAPPLQFQPFPSLLLWSFPLYFQLGGSPYSPAKMTTSRKVDGDQLNVVPTFSKVGRDASHGSHGAAAPSPAINGYVYSPLRQPTCRRQADRQTTYRNYRRENRKKKQLQTRHRNWPTGHITNKWRQWRRQDFVTGGK